jgi:hypothetical protein
MLRRLLRPRDRIVSNIHDIENALRRLSARATVKVVLLSPQKIQFCEQEIRAAAVDGIEFTVLLDIAEALQSSATFDVAILCCHVQGEEEHALLKMRQHGLACLYGVWFWDNHHHHGVNLRVATLADVVFVVEQVYTDVKTIYTDYNADKLIIAKLNIDENPGTPPKYGIRGIPTLILFKNGTVEAQKVGAVSKSQLAAFLDANL